jgi:hypothetical protein
MNEKYEFTGEVKVVFGITLNQIKRKTDGAIGGWIEKEINLSISGNAWVYGNAWVSGNARVYGNAQVSGNARVSGNAWVSGNARVYGNAQVYGDARVYGNARVYGDAQVSGNARVKISPINIIGLPYPITITETHVSIGCHIKTHTEWIALTEDQAAKLDTGGRDFYRFFKHTIISLLAYHTKGK